MRNEKRLGYGWALTCTFAITSLLHAQHVPNPSISNEQRAELVALKKQVAEFRQAGKLAEAIKTAQRAITIEQGYFGDEHPDTLSSQMVLSQCYTESGSFAAARKLTNEVLATRIRLVGETAWQVTDAKLQLAHISRIETLTLEQRERINEAAQLNAQVKSLGDDWKYVEALPLARRTLEIRLELLSEDDPDTMMSLKNLGWILRELSKYDESEILLRRALASRRRIQGEAHPDVAYTLNVIGWLYYNRSDFEQAEKHFRQAYALYEQFGSEKAPDFAMTTNNLAQTAEVRGQYDQAEAFYLEALNVRKKAQGEEHRDYADSLDRLASLYLDKGDFNLAEPLLKHSLTIRTRLLGEKNGQFVVSLNNLADLYQAQGDYQQSEQYMLRAIKISEELYGAKSINLGFLISNLGVVYRKQHRLPESEALARQALQIRKEQFGEKNINYAATLGNLGQVLGMQKKFAEAEQVLLRRLEIERQLRGEIHDAIGDACRHLAELYCSQGSFAAADKFARQALDIYRKIYGEQSHWYAAAQLQLADISFAEGKRKSAAELYLNALQLGRTHVDLSAAIQSERQQLAMNQKYRHVLDRYLTFTASDLSATENVYTWVLRCKGSVFARQQHLRLARAEPQFASQAEKLRTLTASIARLAFAASSTSQSEERQSRLVELTQQKEELESELARSSQLFARHRQERTLTNVQLQEALPTDVALVDFLEYEHRSYDSTRNTPWQAELRMVAFVVRSNFIRRVELGPTQPIMETLALWRNTLSRKRPLLDEHDSAGILRRLVWQPLEGHLGQVSTVVVSPDGALNDLPFVALPGKDSEKYLIEERAIAVLAVPQSLPAMLTREDLSAADNTAPALLAVGGIDYDSDMIAEEPPKKNQAGRRRAGDFQKWEALANTRGEVLAIEDSFRKSHPDGSRTVLTGAQATEAAVRIEAAKHRYLHFATHGFFASSELKSAGSLSRDGGGGHMGISQDVVVGFHPGLLSGIVLAGVNNTNSNLAVHDGVLTALEVSEFDLSRTELAILSACETGRGRVAGGEGVMGLQRAFQVAGAKTVVTSLWKVDDDATRSLMESFYENYWRKEKGMLQSLRDAQLQMLREGGKRGLVREDQADNRTGRIPPHFWAAFVLSGDWR